MHAEQTLFLFQQSAIYCKNLSCLVLEVFTFFVKNMQNFDTPTQGGGLLWDLAWHLKGYNKKAQNKHTSKRAGCTHVHSLLPQEAVSCLCSTHQGTKGNQTLPELANCHWQVTSQ
jgi:hypothetical protein